MQDLRVELLRRQRLDQAIRRQLISGGSVEQDLLDQMHAIDHENTTWLKGIVEAEGWPGRSRVGADGSDAAWLLVQHADHDLPFQRRCLAMLEEAVAKDEASQRNLAYLTDRVMLKERGVQRFGTQFRNGPAGPEPQPLEQPEFVDELRASVGLEPLSEYAKGFQPHAPNQQSPGRGLE